MIALVRMLARAARSAPVAVLLVTVLLTAVFGALAGRAVQDQSQESFSPDNAELEALQFAGEAFEGSTETLVQVLVRGGDVVSVEGLQTVAAVRGAVQATASAEHLGGGDRGPVLSYLAPVEQALATGELDPTTLDDAVVKRALVEGLEQAPPEFAGMARGLIAGEGDPAAADTALVLVLLDTAAIVGDATGDAATTRIVDAVQEIEAAIAALDTPLEVSAFAFELFFEPDETFTTEVSRLFGIAALVIVIILFGVYLVAPRGGTSRLQALRRAAADVGLTLFTILASITWMQGLGVLLGPDHLGLIGYFSPPTQIIPILLIGLGVDYAIHLTSRYREEVAEGHTVDESVGRAVTTVGIALVLATITTALGFLTNVTNPVPAIRDFGILAAVGIAAAFLMMLTFVPAVRTLLDRRAERHDRLPREALASNSESRLPSLMARTSVLAERHALAVLAVTGLLALVGAYGLTQVETEFSFADFVPDGSPLKETFVTIQDEFGGGFGERTSVVIRGDVARPEVHNATLTALRELGDTPGVTEFGGEAAAESPVSALAQALQEDPELAAFAMGHGMGQDLTFTDDGDVAAVYDQLVEVAPDARGFLATDDGEFVASQVIVQTRSQDVGARALAAELRDDFSPVAGTGPTVTPTSNEIVSGVIVEELQSSQVSSMAITLIAALVLLVVTFAVRGGRPILGAVTLLPVVLVVLWVFGTMAATGIPFGPVTAMISALAIGIGVPFSIHITHRFTEDLAEYGDLERTLQSTMRHTGGALAGSALTTMAGFLVLVTSSLPPFRQLGLVVAYAIGYSLLAAVLVLPSLLAVWARWRGLAVATPKRESATTDV